MNDNINAVTPIDLLRTSGILHIAVESTIEPDFFYGIRSHKECEFCLVQSGTCSMYISGTTIECREGDFVFILPYECHSFVSTSLEPCCIFHIHFRLDFLNNPLYNTFGIFKVDLYNYFFTYVSHFIYGKSDFQLDYCAQNVLYEYKNRNASQTSMINYYLFELILLLTKRVQADFPEDTDFNNTYVAETISYIQKHYSEKLTVPLLAQNLKITERYLSKIFYKNTHFTVHDYINFYRINQSVALIQMDYSLTDIAFNVGFSSPPHYAKVFKKYMGLSPKEYRSTLNDKGKVW